MATLRRAAYEGNRRSHGGRDGVGRDPGSGLECDRPGVVPGHVHGHGQRDLVQHLEITIPRGAPVQRGFAFGIPGAKITFIEIEGADGAATTSRLPPNTSTAWLLSGHAPTGTLTVDLMTSNSVSGSFTVLATRSPGKYFSAFPCRIAVGGGPSSSFTPSRQPAYDAATRTWREPVTIPGPGTVTFQQVFTPNGGPLITHGAPPAQLIEGGEVTATKAGSIQMTLVPTAAGKAALKSAGSIKLYLSLSFKPAAAVPATTVLSLVLRSKP